MNKIIRKGVTTKVLMLSATPVNNRINDLKNQIALAYEGKPELWEGKLNTKHSIDEIFRQAQKEFNTWSKLPVDERTADALLERLDFDFFDYLDRSCQRIYLCNRSDSVICLYRRINGGSALYLVFVGLVLIAQTAHKPSADSRYL